MGTYRKEWDCCGSVTETNAWEPEDCPFCTPTKPAELPTIPTGWNITRTDKGPFQTIVVQAPNGFTASVSKHERNPMNVLYMLADALLQSKI